jgi:hypothetical protein
MYPPEALGEFYPDWLINEAQKVCRGLDEIHAYCTPRMKAMGMMDKGAAWCAANFPTPKPDPFRPSSSLICKLGSILVHQQELMSPSGHPVDKGALDSLLSDPEVVAWLAEMGVQGFLPVRR